MNNTIEYQDICKTCPRAVPHDTESIYEPDTAVNRQYKSSLFCMIFSDKAELLKLYNALNNSHYTDPAELEVTTIKGVIYMSMKNDVSFVLGNTVNLYEHQSTYNPNMPLRGFLYLAQLYEKLAAERNIDIYSRKLQMLPTPRYIVFYNGTERQPDKMTLRLSDAFAVENGCLECEATMLNINYGRNKDLMDKCRRLEEYAIFVEKVRTYAAKTKDLSKAVNRAIDECIQEDILRDILTQFRAEVHAMVLTTFNKELYESNLKKDAYTDGMEVGFREGRAAGIDEGRAVGIAEGLNQQLTNQIKKKLAKGKSIKTIAEELEESVETIERLIAKAEE